MLIYAPSKGENFMSNIIKTKNINLLYPHLEYLRNKGIDKTFIANFLDDFIIKDTKGKSLVSYSIDSTKRLTPHYDVNSNSINILLNGFITVVTKYYNQFTKLFNYYPNITDDIKNYIAILILSHELEHTYQVCIKNDLIDSPSIMLKTCYKIFFNSKSEISNYSSKEKLNYLICVFMYEIHNKQKLALERNANLEAMDLIYKLASLETNKDLTKLFEELRMLQALIGYTIDGSGVLVNTAKKTLQFNKLQGFEEIETLSFEEKIRYGLTINKDEYHDLLQVILQSEDDRFQILKKRIKTSSK